MATRFRELKAMQTTTTTTTTKETFEISYVDFFVGEKSY
jgi:hypothetical protein